MAQATTCPDGFYTVVMRGVAFDIPISCMVGGSAHHGGLTCLDPIPGSSAGRRVDAQHTLTTVGNDLTERRGWEFLLLHAAYKTLALGGRTAYVYRACSSKQSFPSDSLEISTHP